jgi:hypothetical protein
MTRSSDDDLPFPRRWIAYIAIKLVVLAALVGVALKYYGLW